MISRCLPLLLYCAACLAGYAEVTIERISLSEGPVATSSNDQQQLVQTQHYVLHAIATALLKDAGIATRWDKLDERSGAAASAVITLRSVFPEDASFQRARQTNIHVVEIDASRPLDGSTPGISTISAVTPLAPGLPPACWLSLENLAIMAEIVAHDLSRVFVHAKTSIETNLASLRREIQRLSALAAKLGADVDHHEIRDTAGHFGYFIQSMGLAAVPGDAATPALVIRAEDPAPHNAVPINPLLGPMSTDDPWPDVLAAMEKNIRSVFAAL